MKSVFTKTVAVTLAFMLMVVVNRDTGQAQQTPQNTGRSYSAGDPVRPPAKAAPQAPSPVTFTDITAQTGI